MATPSYLAYHEPSLAEILISATFLLALNGVHSVLDRTLACGLVGQVLVGTAWGAPGARWLSVEFQRAASGLGYLGLVLVVFAGGVETDVAALRRNMVLSIAVAATGVAVPVALSFALFAAPGPFLGMDGGAALLSAFAAGAALCSTSLGTTFSVLQASGLSRTRLGAVLASAALLDDVVGLVMVRIITSLGQTKSSGIEPATILRPVLVSVAFAVVVALACRYALKPGRRAFDSIVRRWESEGQRGGEGSTSRRAKVKAWISSPEAAFIVQTALLILLVVAADYAGASILLAAYLAGVVVSWWDGQRDGSEVPLASQGEETSATQRSRSDDRQTQHSRRSESESGDPGPSPETIDVDIAPIQHTAQAVFDTYYAQAVNRMLKPFFFASIGFSIPISRLFVGEIVWRGIIYSILMIFGKLVCGLWLVRFPISVSGALSSMGSFVASKYNQVESRARSWSFRSMTKSSVAHETQSNSNSPNQATCTEMRTLRSPPRPPVTKVTTSSPSAERTTPPRPLSLYPAAVIGCVMVARGEIGFLISSMAESQGVFRRGDETPREASELFLVVTWAIFICTILGPVCTGLLVRRIKLLEKASEASRGGARDVLGVWGVGKSQ
ncbi:Sodium/hydrogen exchanger [Xylaria palmicola]|nr:Sodium/hydrogen exchanger [Xylaria palmicola]